MQTQQSPVYGVRYMWQYHIMKMHAVIHIDRQYQYNTEFHILQFTSSCYSKEKLEAENQLENNYPKSLMLIDQ